MWRLDKTEIWLSFAKRDLSATGERRSTEKQDKSEIYFVVDQAGNTCGWQHAFSRRHLHSQWKRLYAYTYNKVYKTIILKNPSKNKSSQLFYVHTFSYNSTLYGPYSHFF